MQTIQAPKGTRDFYPDEMAFEQYLFDAWHRSCRRFGFEQYDGPMFEHLELYTQKSGDEIEKQLYTFADKGGRELALRPELTPTLARMAAARGTNLKRPARWYSISRLFRYERMQRGRLREFVQLNMDILGVDSVTADTELIAAAVGMMNDLGLDCGDFKARVSSRTLLEELFVGCGVANDQLKPLYTLLDKKRKMSADDFYIELRGLLGDDDLSSRVNKLFDCKTLDDVDAVMSSSAKINLSDDNFSSDKLSSDNSSSDKNLSSETSSSDKTPSDKSPQKPSALSDLKKLFSLIDAYGLSDYVVFDIGIVRGLAYYTGIVFELFDAGGTMRAIAGGGRYDNLVGLYGGPPTPAVGFAVGDVVLADLIRAKNIAPAPPPRCDVFVVSIETDDDAYINVIKTANNLRAANVSCEFSLKANQNVGKQLKSADNARARYALFIGGDEGRSGKARLKNLSDGAEILLDENDLTNQIARYIN